MQIVVRLMCSSVVGLLLVGCGSSPDAVKDMPKVTPADQAKLDEQHQAMKTKATPPAGEANK